MARQVGEIKFTGTVEDLCFYKMEGDYFVRRKSSLTGKRFRKDKAFEGSRRSAGLLAQASALASKLYHQLPAEQKGRAVFNALTGKIKLQLKEGRTDEQIEHWFVRTYLPPPPPTATDKDREKKKTARVCFAFRQDKKLPTPVLLPPLVKASAGFQGRRQGPERNVRICSYADEDDE